MPNQQPSARSRPDRPPRIFLEPTLTRDGTLDGAWWPYSTDLCRELPALIRILQDRLGPVLRIRLDRAAWDEVPVHLLLDGRFLRVSSLSATPHTIRMIRGNQDGFLLLVIPPDTTAPVAAAAMKTAARTGNTLTANEILLRCREAPSARLPGPRMRRYHPFDQEAVLALIDADRLPGQPACTASELAHALAGTSRRDPVAWAGLEPPRTCVLADHHDRVIGAVSYAAHRDGGPGQILWLHGQEIPDVVDDLVAHALQGLAGRTVVHAFTASLGLGLAALPAGRRPVTTKVLERAGFRGRDSWRYLHRRVPPEAAATGRPGVEVVRSQAPPGWWVKAEGDGCSAELVVEEPAGGLGVVWWFGAGAGQADETLERDLLREADRLLAEHGVGETVMYVAGTPITPVFEAAGFTEVDHLVSYVQPVMSAADPLAAAGRA
ncbi:DUF5994 family protein [Nonomuraea gerenzanensis]|uniref:Uncharacterized protein n=1 Tax=Nonomuraea gerenzanensis TaxID=93944 RepID=A0A1M4EM89_9ACTN|nr:DUF5994 family protein [Nonomuraea gerenzanensis]UBU11451.1 DUF5994 family protein [Nonomuraea gerenzanensis]SBO99935.1 hypothetical protein BN4615_P9451 [Nonomuraea gerenzanensis]